jgi:hypothetical protein
LSTIDPKAAATLAAYTNRVLDGLATLLIRYADYGIDLDTPVLDQAIGELRRRASEFTRLANQGEDETAVPDRNDWYEAADAQVHPVGRGTSR